MLAYNKALRIIDSCTTLDHLRVARKYCELYVDRYSQSGKYIVWLRINFNKKVAELEDLGIFKLKKCPTINLQIT